MCNLKLAVGRTQRLEEILHCRNRLSSRQREEGGISAPMISCGIEGLGFWLWPDVDTALISFLIRYMQPGADCVGFISCTGTNFLVRANAFRKV